MRTPEQIKTELHNALPVHFHPGDPEPRLTPFKYHALEALHAETLAYIQRLETQEPKWISVKERLPEEGQTVFFIPSTRPKAIYIGKLSYVGKRNGAMFAVQGKRWETSYYSQYWMPRPESPKE